MGRGKVVVEKIQSETARQVTFCKRKNGLLKKGAELAVLCDAEVALILFSDRGTLHQFSTTHMVKILERYRECSYSQDGGDNGHTGGSGSQTYHKLLKLRATYESLTRKHRHMMGEDIEALDVKGLQNLEKQLEKALSQSRRRKTDTMMDHLDELHQLEHELSDTNREMKAQLGELQRLHSIPDPSNDGRDLGRGDYGLLQPPTHGGPDPTLQMWF